MKYIDILKAQKRYEEIGEILKELSILTVTVYELLPKINVDIGYKIIRDCNQQLEDEIQKLRKERKEMEV